MNGSGKLGVTFMLAVALAAGTLGVASTVSAEDHAAGPEEQLSAAVQTCEESQAEFDARSAEQSLYSRLGGRDGIRTIFVELIEILSSDPNGAAMLEGVDRDRMIEVSTDHLASQTGGSEAYTGRDITEVHRPMNINAEMFMAAGAAFDAAMAQAGVAPEVAQETQCLMIGMRDEVMAPAHAAH